MSVIKTNVLTPLNDKKFMFLRNVFITIRNKRISSVETATDFHNYQDWTHLLCLPGFIDTHVHLSQYYIRGRNGNDLLKWLNDYVFVEEARSRDQNYARKLSRHFFQALLQAGTTTSVVYTAPQSAACETAFETAREMGVRAMIGKTMMDTNSPADLRENSDQSFQDSVALFQRWHQKTDLLEYIFSPRFAPVCTPGLMKKIADFARANQAFIQTHLAENTDEISLVKSLFPNAGSYTEVYHKYGLLGPRTILGHAIHLSDKEIALLAETKSKIAHCPDSNFFLKSGSFPLTKIKKAGIDFALATDVGAGTTLSMPEMMKLCNYRQSDYRVKPAEAFYYATLAGARVLGKEQDIGSVTAGKFADLIFLDLNPDNFPDGEDLLSCIIYLNREIKVKSVMIAGSTVFSA